MHKYRQPIIRAALLLLAGAALIASYLSLVHITGFMPRCPFRLLTGFDCPGCGSQRALQALIDGHPLTAIRHNLILLPAIPYLALCALHWIFPASERITKTYRALTSPAAVWWTVAIIAAWWILRNIHF